MTRRPDRIGGVWVATLTPATSSSDLLRRREQVACCGRRRARRGTRRRSRRRAGWRRGRGSPARPHPLLGGHLRQPGHLALARLVAEVEGELDRVDRRRRRRSPWTGRRPWPRPRRRRAGAARGRRRVVAGPRVGAVAGGRVVGLGPGDRPGRLPPDRRRPAGQPAAPAGPLDGPGVPVQLGHLEQQVAPGDPAAAAHAVRGQADAVDRVEAPGQHQPLDDRPGHPGAVPEVGERVVRPGRDDPLHLGLVDPLHLGQRQPDAVARRPSSRRPAPRRTPSREALTSRPSTRCRAGGRRRGSAAWGTCPGRG